MKTVLKYGSIKIYVSLALSFKMCMVWELLLLVINDRTSVTVNSCDKK